MTFDEVLVQVQELLQREKRVSYRGLKRRFDLDDEYLEDLKEELIGAKRLAADEEGRFLVWIGGTAIASSQLPVASPQSPISNPQNSDSRPKTLDPRLAAAERRQLTVEFIDLVGSTALSEQLDPEELREVVRAYQKTSAEVIARYAGHIAQYLGDGLLVYFGYPTAHEDDAARAVRAGLGIVGAIHELPLPNTQLQHPLQVRIGIHTGPVVVGEMGGGGRHEQLALGETPNLAARVQGKAAPDTVVISAATQRLVAGLFEYEDRGLHALKGISTPVPLYRVTAASAAHSRFEAAVRSGLTPLVGREEELQFLQQRWEHARAGAGRAVLVTGEPGIGKSRLVQELKEQVTREGATRIEFRCSPYHQNSALYPVIEHLQRLLQFQWDDTADTKLEKLQQALASYQFPEVDTVPLLAALLSLPQPDGFPPLTLSPQKQKEKTQETLVRWLFEEAEKTTVYCSWEDLHWADPSTLELLTLCLDQIPTARMLALLICRPEFTPPWGTRSYLSQLILGRLGRREVESIVARVTGGRAFPVEVVEQVAAKTDGVPLFVEELTKMIVESGVVRAVNSHYELTGPLSTLAIPSTLHDSLMARLDRLATAKEVAQLGATIGREFSYEVLQAIAALEDATLQHGLKQLVEAELVYQRGLPPDARYIFKHALIQDTAYQSLLKSTRQQYHQQIAQVLADRFPEMVETQPELLAHHYTEASLIAQAIPYWQKAGQRASQRSANVEAISHLTKGLQVLKTLPDTPQRAQYELTLQMALCAPLVATKGWAAPEVERTCTRARELCRQVGETPQLFRVLRGLWSFYAVRAELQTARELGEQLLTLARSTQDPSLLLEARLALGATLVWLGEFAPAREHFKQNLALYDPQKHRSHAFLYGQDPGMVCLSYAAYALWYLGYPDQALKSSREAVALAQEMSLPFGLAYALDHAAQLRQLCRQGQATQEQAEAVMALSTEHGFPFYLARGTLLQGWALAEQGKGEEGLRQMHQGLAAWRATGAELERTHYLALLAEAYGKVGQAEKGLATVTEALAVVNKNGERFCEAELYRLKGELSLKSRQVEDKSKTSQGKLEVEKEAEECFWKAVEIARKQQAKSLELRAATSLARLWQQQGKKEQARHLLVEIYGWFTEGFDTKDLQEAKALLAELT